MGEMIGNIAHQWRQPLSLISTIASGIKVKMEFKQFDEKELIPNMENIIKQTNYLSNTIDDFRNFIQNSNDKGEICVSEIIKKTLSILNPSIVSHNITIVLNTDDDIKIYGYENQLIQAIINILNNSKDALKEKVTDTFPSENGKQYKYPRPLMHLRLSICFLDSASRKLVSGWKDYKK